MWAVPFEANTKLTPSDANRAAPMGGVGEPPAVVDEVTPSSNCAWAKVKDATRKQRATSRFKADSPKRLERRLFQYPRRGQSQ